MKRKIFYYVNKAGECGVDFSFAVTACNKKEANKHILDFIQESNEEYDEEWYKFNNFKMIKSKELPFKVFLGEGFICDDFNVDFLLLN